MELFLALLTLLSLPIVPFVSTPMLALAPAGAFGIASVATLPRKSVGLWCACVSWLLYLVYELRMHAWSQTVTAPIRIDMLLVVPFLWAVSIFGVVSWYRAARARREDGDTEEA